MAVITPCICLGRSGGKEMGSSSSCRRGISKRNCTLLVSHGQTAATAHLRLRQAHLQALQVKALWCQTRLDEEVCAGQSERSRLQTAASAVWHVDALRAPLPVSLHQQVLDFKGLRGLLLSGQLPLQGGDT